MKLKKVETNFTIVSNNILSNEKLSWKAKGIYAYLYSKPEGWNFAVKRMIAEATDGKDSTVSALQELEKAGYLQRVKQNDGRMDYILDFEPMPENPSLGKKPEAEKPTLGKTHLGKTRPLSKTDNISNTEKKVILTAKGADIIKAFEAVDPKNKTYYGNKTQRLACEFLISEYGFEDVIAVVAQLPKINTMRLYIGQITTPSELKDRWVKVKNKFEEYKTDIIKSKSSVAFS